MANKTNRDSVHAKHAGNNYSYIFGMFGVCFIIYSFLALFAYTAGAIRYDGNERLYNSCVAAQEADNAEQGAEYGYNLDIHRICWQNTLGNQDN